MLAESRRPKEFGEVVGLTGPIGRLTGHRAKHGRFPEVILLHGPYGCGKTTLALIIASLIAHKSSILEINAADENGVADMRKLADRMAHPPLIGDVTACILDECHRLSKDAQSILLTPMERVHKHAQWILCTTNPEKLEKTLLSRCFRVEVSPLDSADAIFELIEPVGGTRDQAEAFWNLGVTSPRDVLSHLEADSAPLEGGVELFKAVQEFWARGASENVRKFLRSAEPDQVIAWQHTAIAYGRTMILNRATPSVLRKLELLVGAGGSSDVTLRSTAIICAVLRSEVKES